MQDYKIDLVHKHKIIFRSQIIFLFILIACYAIKIFGGDLFEYVANSTTIIEISITIENTLWLNWICYGALNYILVYFITFAICERFGSKKWWLNLVIIVFAFGMAILRYFLAYEFSSYMFPLTFAFDFAQYIIFPILIAKLIFKNEFWLSLFNSLKTYFMIMGIQTISLTLNNNLITISGYGFIVNLLLFVEIYVFSIIIYLNNNYRRLINANIGTN